MIGDAGVDAGVGLAVGKVNEAAENDDLGELAAAKSALQKEAMEIAAAVFPIAISGASEAQSKLQPSTARRPQALELVEKIAKSAR
jgi:hypothetical protein